MACEGPPPDTPPEAIANGLVGKSYYNKVDNYHYDGGVAYGFAEYVYHRPDGIATGWTQRFGGTNNDSTSKRPWSVRRGQVCYGSGDNPYCRNVYIERGQLSFSSGQIRKGDIGRTQRRNGLRPHDASNLTLAQSIEQGLRALNDVVQTAGRTPGGQALASSITAVCANGGCEVDQAQVARDNAARATAAASARQCTATVNQCLAQCSALSGVSEGDFWGSRALGRARVQGAKRSVGQRPVTNFGHPDHVGGITLFCRPFYARPTNRVAVRG